VNNKDHSINQDNGVQVNIHIGRATGFFVEKIHCCLIFGKKVNDEMLGFDICRDMLILQYIF